MPDIQELSDSDMSVAERMAQLDDSVLFGEETEDKKAGQERDDAPVAPDEIRDEPPEALEEAKAEDDQQEAVEAAEQEVEITDPNGGEPVKVKLSELVEAHKEYTAFKGQKDQILQQEESRAREFATQRMVQVEQWSRSMATQLQAAMQMVAPPQPPDIEMRNPSSAKYDPDRFETERYQYEQRMGAYRQAQGMAQHFSQQAEQLAAAQKEDRENREMQKLTTAWPEFANQETLTAFIGDMGKNYGFAPAELDEVMTDHRQALVARDALKWREHVAKQGKAQATLKDKVAAKAPAKATASGKGSALTSEQSSYMNARKALKANGKDMTAAARGFLKYV